MLLLAEPRRMSQNLEPCHQVWAGLKNIILSYKLRVFTIILRTCKGSSIFTILAGTSKRKKVIKLKHLL